MDGHFLDQFFLPDVTKPFMLINAVGVFLADFHRLILAETVNDDNFIGPMKAIQATPDIVFLIPDRQTG